MLNQIDYHAAGYCPNCDEWVMVEVTIGDTGNHVAYCPGCDHDFDAQPVDEEGVILSNPEYAGRLTGGW